MFSQVNPVCWCVCSLPMRPLFTQTDRLSLHELSIYAWLPQFPVTCHRSKEEFMFISHTLWHFGVSLVCWDESESVKGENTPKNLPVRRRSPSCRCVFEVVDSIVGIEFSSSFKYVVQVCCEKIDPHSHFLCLSIWQASCLCYCQEFDFSSVEDLRKVG